MYEGHRYIFKLLRDHPAPEVIDITNTTKQKQKTLVQIFITEKEIFTEHIFALSNQLNVLILVVKHSYVLPRIGHVYI